jgi:hypothetical protein
MFALQSEGLRTDRRADSVRHMYFLGAGVLIVVSILVIVVGLQQRKRRR